MNIIDQKGVEYFFTEPEMFLELTKKEKKRMLEILKNTGDERFFAEDICKIAKENDLPLMYVAEYFNSLLEKESDEEKHYELVNGLKEYFKKKNPAMNLQQCLVKTVSNVWLIIVLCCTIFISIQSLLAGTFIKVGFSAILCYAIAVLMGTHAEYVQQKRPI